MSFAPGARRPRVSVCSPVHNELRNLPALVDEVTAVMRPLFGSAWEQLLVDDGSSDGSGDRIRELQRQYPELRLVSHPHNLGQRAALQTSFEEARGDVFVTLAADLQNDPVDIPRLVEEVKRGPCQCCTGARVERKDALFYSAATMLLTAFMDFAFGLRVRDVSASFFAVQRVFVDGLRLEENDHRYILAILQRRGARVMEIPTRHRPRLHGRSHYTRWKVPRAAPEVLRFSARYYRGFYDRRA